ncbi:MAG: hypothetical protein WDW36_003879 [Sanguina aurantia]
MSRVTGGHGSESLMRDCERQLAGGMPAAAVSKSSRRCACGPDPKPLNDGPSLQGSAAAAAVAADEEQGNDTGEAGRELLLLLMDESAAVERP